MDYEDDSYDEHQQYEDELYRDPNGESESSDGIDSEVEDTMLSHIHYSTNVYKKAGVNSAKLVEGQEANTTSNNATGTSSAVATPPKRHLAVAPTATEDYFRAVNRGNELDSENDDSFIRPPKRVKLLTTTESAGGNSNGGLKDNNHSEQDEEEESRYSVEKKKDIGLNSWSQHAGTPEKLAIDMSDADGSDGEVIESADQSHSESEESHNESDGLDEHFLDLGGSKQGEDKELNNYDLDAELGHLESEDFKGRSRYYIERVQLCNKCGQPGHQARECMAIVCNICGTKNEHDAANCPVSICYNCRRKGHRAEFCPYPRGYGAQHVCNTCGSRDHASEDCPTVWRQYVFCSDEPLQQTVQYCYNCAALGHFGDDCHRPRPTYARNVSSAFFDPSKNRARDRPSSSSGAYSSSSSYPPSHSSSGYRDQRSGYRDRYSNNPRDGDRDYDREVERERDRQRDRDRQRERERDRDRERDRGRDRDRRPDDYDSRNYRPSHSYVDRDNVGGSDYHDSRSISKNLDSGGSNNNNNGNSNVSSSSSSKKKKKNKSSGQNSSDSTGNKTTTRVVSEVLTKISKKKARMRGHDESHSEPVPHFKQMASLRKGYTPSSQAMPPVGLSNAQPMHALTPTMATGGSLGRDRPPTHNAMSAPRSVAGGSLDNPVVISSSPSYPKESSSRSSNNNGGRSSSDRGNSNTNSGSRGNSRRNSPERIPSTGSSRQSFAEQNAFPRGGSGGGGGQSSGANGEASRPPGPMYTGGYTRRR